MSLEFLSPAIRLLDATVGALRGANFEVHFITVMKLLRMGLTSSHSLSNSYQAYICSQFVFWCLGKIMITACVFCTVGHIIQARHLHSIAHVLLHC